MTTRRVDERDTVTITIRRDDAEIFVDEDWWPDASFNRLIKTINKALKEIKND